MRTSFHHQPEAQHPKSSTIHKSPADYPIFCQADISRTLPSPIAFFSQMDERPDGSGVSDVMAASARLRTFHRKRLCPRSAKRPQQKSTRYSITPSAIVITPILSGRHRCYARI